MNLNPARAVVLTTAILCACTPDDNAAWTDDAPTHTDAHDTDRLDTDNTDTDTGDTDNTDTDTDPPPRNTAQRCDHGGYLDAWFPRMWTRVQEYDSEGRLREYPFIERDEERYPGWRIEEHIDVEGLWFGTGGFKLYHLQYGVQEERDARLEDDPGSIVSTIERGEFEQSGTALAMDSPSCRFGCRRRVRPTTPHDPVQQSDLACTGMGESETIWLSIKQDSTDYVDPDCLALHEPPPLPTRWGLMETTDERGTRTHPFQEENRYTSTDLYLRSDGTGGLVSMVTVLVDSKTLSWPERDEQGHEWMAAGDGWQFFLEDGRVLDCTRDDDIGEFGDEIRTWALDCTDQDGRGTWWVPMDMTYPWGWGSHDTPYGWWWEPVE